MTDLEDYPGTGDLPDRLAFVKPDRARLWIDLHDRDDVPTAATLADGHDVSTATIYRMLEELAELGLAENVSTYRDGRATTGFRALEPGADSSREILADGGPVFEGGRATTCPDCGGDLQYQNRQSILCLGCEQDYEHWKNASSHHLVEVDARTGESEIVESTPRNVETDGGQSSNDTKQLLGYSSGWVRIHPPRDMIPGPLVEVIGTCLCHVCNHPNTHRVSRTSSHEPSHGNCNHDHKQPIEECLHNRTELTLVGRPREVAGQRHTNRLTNPHYLTNGGYVFDRFVPRQLLRISRLVDTDTNQSEGER